MVALLAEGVDRNRCSFRAIRATLVALLAEGVDRNPQGFELRSDAFGSPSSRRAWIEIKSAFLKPKNSEVALLAEGVDRN